VSGKPLTARAGQAERSRLPATGWSRRRLAVPPFLDVRLALIARQADANSCTSSALPPRAPGGGVHRRLENPSEAFHNIAAWLVRDGLTDEEITKVLGGNAVRALAQIWPA
jgi:hypothetical protein